MTRFITLITLATVSLAGCRDATPPTGPSLETVLAAPGTGTQGQIVYSSSRISSGYGISVLDAATGRTRRLTRNRSPELYPAWSPDGQKIAFQGNRGAGWQIYVVDATGDNLTKVTNEPLFASEPSWSPDGGRLLYSATVGAQRDVSLTSLDGTVPAACVLCGATNDFSPAWSPGSGPGLRFAFTSTRDNPSGEIYIYDDSKSPNISRLTVGGGHSAAWSPDGTKIAFMSLRNGDWDIYVVSADGTGSPMKLTDNTGSDLQPAWSPDGSKIVFQSVVDGKWQLYVMSATDGSGVTRLIRSQTSDESPDWKP